MYKVLTKLSKNERNGAMKKCGEQKETDTFVRKAYKW